MTASTQQSAVSSQPKERPILFSGAMVRQILTCAKCGKISVAFPCEHCGSTEFVKTNTRRVMKADPPKGATFVGQFRASGKPYDHAFQWCSGDPKDVDTWEFLLQPSQPRLYERMQELIHHGDAEARR